MTDRLRQIAFNLNGHVRIRLTPVGTAAYLKFFRDLGLPPMPLEPDENGFVRMQLWETYQFFAAAVCVGGRPPFETSIILEDMLTS